MHLLPTEHPLPAIVWPPFGKPGNISGLRARANPYEIHVQDRGKGDVGMAGREGVCRSDVGAVATKCTVRAGRGRILTG